VNAQTLRGAAPQAGRKFFDFAAHPLFLAGLAIMGAIAGVMLYAPAFLICEVCILLALHRSHVLRGRGKLYQSSAYGIVLLLSASILFSLDVWVKKPAREYLQTADAPVASGANAPSKTPNGDVPAAASSYSNGLIPLPGGIFSSPASNPMAAPPTANAGNAAENPANSAEAALMLEMRERLTRDAGDPQKINLDVQWMRDQFERGWAGEPPELARKHREETEQTARIILQAASNRAAVLEIVPHITIDK
jgi:hypothetical protein